LIGRAYIDPAAFDEAEPGTKAKIIPMMTMGDHHLWHYEAPFVDPEGEFVV